MANFRPFLEDNIFWVNFFFDRIPPQNILGWTMFWVKIFAIFFYPLSPPVEGGGVIVSQKVIWPIFTPFQIISRGNFLFE